MPISIVYKHSLYGKHRLQRLKLTIVVLSLGIWQICPKIYILNINIKIFLVEIHHKEDKDDLPFVLLGL